MRTRAPWLSAPQSVALAVPVVAPASMWWLFGALKKRMSPVTAYNVGFGLYWSGWCCALPVAVLGPARAWHVVTSGRVPSRAERALLLLPILGAATTTLWPQRRFVDTTTAVTMVGVATINAAGEELLWRGLFVELFPDDPPLAVLWPLTGFAVWHLAPQRVLPSSKGRLGLTLGAAVVGAASGVVAYRSEGLRHVLIPHIATDSCGVAATVFRLGRAGASPRR